MKISTSASRTYFIVGAVFQGILASPANAQDAVPPSSTSAGAASSASAQAAIPAPAGQEANQTSMGDIIVTAQKRSERLSDVPLSITVASGEQLRSRGVTSAADLERIVPGFTAQQSAHGVPVFTIRGIGFYDTSTGVSPTVGVYVDQVPLPFSVETAGASFDLDRVEVLKGPQGTLFGQNSTGGAVNYIATPPTDGYRMGSTITYGRFNQLDLDGFVSGPLTTGVKARLAVRHEGRDDWQYSQTRDDKLGRRDFTTARLLLDVDPTDKLTLHFNFNGWIDRSDTEAAQFITYRPTSPNGFPEQKAFFATAVPAPSKPRVADWDPGVDFARHDRLGQAAMRADLHVSDTVDLTSITAYTAFRGRNPNDSDGVAFNDLFFLIKSNIRTFSQELRLAGTTPNLKWMIGGNYEHDTADEDQLGHELSSNSGIATPAFVSRYRDFIIRNDQRISTAAVFGSLDYNIIPTVTVQGSIRYTDQHRHADGCLFDSGDGALAAAFSNLYSLLKTGALGNVTIPAGACATSDAAFNPVSDIPARLNENNVSWRAGVNWKPTNRLLVYANATKGYKAGNFSAIPVVTTSQYSPVTQESVLAYEAGFKGSFRNPRVSIEGAVFHYDYDDKQILGHVNIFPFGALPKLLNVPKSRVNGFELSADINPATGLDLRTGISHVDSKITRSYLAASDNGVLVDLKGEVFPNTPRWQLSGGLNYEFASVHDTTAYVGADVNYRSSAVADLGNDPLFRIKNYAILDLRAGIRSANHKWSFEIFGRNVTNTFYWNGVSHVIDSVSRYAGLPATYGITVSFRN